MKRKHIELMPLINNIYEEEAKNEGWETKNETYFVWLCLSQYRNFSLWKRYRCTDDVLNKMIVVNVLCACNWKIWKCLIDLFNSIHRLECIPMNTWCAHKLRNISLIPPLLLSLLIIYYYYCSKFEADDCCYLAVRKRMISNVVRINLT